jgi:hypothetical protein|tara:strand:+ start:1784 stop:2446 length:663 start_codon:yes stop_codon:yes gene_type:complete
MSYKLRFISLACFVLPVFTVIISYIISINLDLVAKCIPNFEGCTSISRVGRYEPVKFFFKPMMYFYSLIIFFFWITFSKEINNFKIKSKNLVILTFITVIFLCLYITFLGESNLYSFFKRIGIYFYIISIVLLQLFSNKILISNQKKLSKIFNYKIVKLNYGLSWLLVISGLILLPVLVIKIDTFPQIKNIISWNYFLLIQLFFLLFFISFKKLIYPTAT